LYENGTIAIVEAVSPELGNRVQRVRVQLPGTSSELLAKFREKNIDFAAHSNTEDGGAVFLNLLGRWGWSCCQPATWLCVLAASDQQRSTATCTLGGGIHVNVHSRVAGVLVAYRCFVELDAQNRSCKLCTVLL